MTEAGHKPVVWVLDAVHAEAISTLERDCIVRGPGEGDFWAEADAVIVRNSTVTQDDIARAPRLKVIGKHGAGTDNIDSRAAAAAGIEVHSTPGLNADSVAELAVAMALCLLRNVHGHTEALRRGSPLTGTDRIGREVSETAVGILGFGAIGRSVAKRLAGFGSTLRAFDLDPSRQDVSGAVEMVSSRDELLRSSDILFLHLPLTEESRNSIGRDALSAMPRGSYLVNCARGGIVDEDALAEALASGQLAGAACDVFAIEPPQRDNPLLGQPNFIATPHLGASTNAGLARVGKGIASIVSERLRALPGAGRQSQLFQEEQK